MPTTTTIKAQGIPRPLVRTNQWVIVLSVIIAIALHFYWILLLPILAGLSGVILGKNFIILFSKRFLRKKSDAYILEDKGDLRFNQVIATSLLSLSLLSALLGQTILALLFAALVFAAAGIAIAGFCIGCWLRFQIHQWQYRHHTKKSN